jgi:hypothetical protein
MLGFNVAVKTYSEQLEEVQTAISAILTGAQQYTYEGRQITRASLNTLFREEKRLRLMAKREAAGGGIGVYGATPTDA